VLLDILKALSEAHEAGKDGKGLTKAEIIQQVWRENYRPEAHDNKLYYNINRLRKLIEPNMKSPVFLLNWKEGYRLAPGLNVQVISSGDSQFESGGEEKHA
jgi:DNA-binding winged helix-turn-helix (wHTH) protein